jgi:hypothetical protein
MTTAAVRKLDEAEKLKERVTKHFVRSKSLERAMMTVIEFSMADVEFRSQNQERLGETVATRYGPISSYTKKEIKNSPVFPVADLRGMLEFFENRSHHIDNRYVAIASAFLGGLLGGLASIIAAWQWH